MVGSFHTDWRRTPSAERIAAAGRADARVHALAVWALRACASCRPRDAATARRRPHQPVADPSVDERRGHGALHAAEASGGAPRALARSDKRPAVIYVGRLSKEKGLHLLPRRDLRDVPARRRAPAGLVGDGPYRRELEAALPDAVFTGTLAPREVARHWRPPTCFCFRATPIRRATSCSRRRPAACRRSCPTAAAHKEYIQPDVTGVVCPGGDAEAFGHAPRRCCATDGAARWARPRAVTPPRSDGTPRWRRCIARIGRSARAPCRLPAGRPDRRRRRPVPPFSGAPSVAEVLWRLARHRWTDWCGDGTGSPRC